MDSLREILKRKGVTLVHCSKLKKASGWRKWKRRNVLLLEKEAEDGGSPTFEIHYNKDKAPECITQMTLLEHAVVSSVADDRLNTVFKVLISQDTRYPLKFSAENSKEKLVWIQKLNACISTLAEGCSVSLNSARRDSDGGRQRTNSSETEFDGGDSSSPRPLSHKRTESEAALVTRGFSLSQLAAEIKLMKGKKNSLLKDNYSNSTMYRNSFTGAALVMWLIRHGFESTRARALALGQSMLSSGLIAHVTKSARALQDSEEELYHFLESYETKLVSLKKMTKRLQHQVEELDLQVYQLENNQEITMQRARTIDRDTEDRHFQSTITIFLLALALVVRDLSWELRFSFPGMIGIVLCSLYGKRALRMWFDNDRRHRALSIAIPMAGIRGGGDVKNSSGSSSPSRALRNDLRVARKLTKTLSVAVSGAVAAAAASKTVESASKLTDDDDDDDDDGDVSSKISRSLGNAKTLYSVYDEDNDVVIDCWSQPDATKFKVRGVTYLSDGIKVFSAQSTHQLLAIHMCRSDVKVDHIAAKTKQFSDILSAHMSLKGGSGRGAGDDTMSLSSPKASDELNASDIGPPGTPGPPAPSESMDFFIVHFQVPGYSMSMYFKLRESTKKDTVWMSLYRRFMNGDDDFRNSRIKIIPKLIEGGGFMVQRMINGKPALLGRKIECEYYRGANYLEMDIDIASSYAAGVILGAVKGVTKKVTLDLGFTIQGNGDGELPERMIGAGRFHKVDLGNKPGMEY